MKLTWGSQVGANPIPIPHPTNLALFGHKITLSRFIQGAHTIAGGSNRSREDWVPWPHHFNHWLSLCWKICTAGSGPNRCCLYNPKKTGSHLWTSKYTGPTRALLFSQHLLFLFADFNDCNGEKNCLKSVKRNERFCKNNSGPEGTGFLDHGVFIIKFEKFQKSLRNHKACKSLKFS